jgi:hypothetical protein
VNAVAKLPCQIQPELWDLPYASDDVPKALIRHKLAAALESCSGCPALHWCAAYSRRIPPQHHCVQGGLIWSGKDREPIAYENWRPSRVPFPEGRAAA